MQNILTDVYDNLRARYGDLHWWPARTPYEVIVGAILTQNTAWGNVEKAIANFYGDALASRFTDGAGGLRPEAVFDAGVAELADIIRPAGFFNQKAQYLKKVTAWFALYNYEVSAVQSVPLAKLRPELLSIKGVGQETADSILLYAFGFPTFVVDAYTMRLCERYPVNAGNGYAEVKSYFEMNLPPDAALYNNYHALIVINGKRHCKKKPACDGCPLENLCGRRVL